MPGIITIAQGSNRYIEMAKMLAFSLIQTNPDIKRAVISDAPETEFEGLFDIYIPYNSSYGDGFSQKLCLDKYSPFEETLFIDADCLVVKSLNDAIRFFKPHQFAVFGDQISTGEWYMDVAAMCKKFNVPSIPLFNGGVYYFKRGETATNIYTTAREIRDQYFQIEIDDFRGSMADEPLMAIAMAINKVEAVDDQALIMRTPIGINGALKIDVLNEVCAFDKQGEKAEPAIMHFAGAYSIAFHYKREIAKLKLLKVSTPLLNKKLVSLFINGTYNVSYGSYVFCKRVLKVILRGEKFDFTNWLPIYSNL